MFACTKLIILYSQWIVLLAHNDCLHGTISELPVRELLHIYERVCVGGCTGQPGNWLQPGDLVKPQNTQELSPVGSLND